jgi:hypothetical protein
MLSGFIPMLVEKLELSEDVLKTMLDEVLVVKNPRALAVKKVVADENRCIYIAERSVKADKRCVKKHTDGSEYCTAHRNVVEKREEKAKTPKSPKGKKVATPPASVNPAKKQPTVEADDETEVEPEEKVEDE